MSLQILYRSRFFTANWTIRPNSLNFVKNNKSARLLVGIKIFQPRTID